MLGRYTTLVGRIMAAVALFTLLTGASEEYGGVITHVDLQRYEHPVPDGYDSWDDVIPNAETGPRYFWAPGEMVLVQRTDGTIVEARNEFASAGYLSRVSILQSRTGEWFITSVERRGELEEPPPVRTEPPPREDLLMTQDELPPTGEVMDDSIDPVTGEEIVIQGDGDIAEPSYTWVENPGYEKSGLQGE